jgi:hypothetical protein
LGIVHLTGDITGGTGAEIAFVLPPGYQGIGDFPAGSTNGAYTAEGPCVVSLNVGAGSVAVDDGCDNTRVSLDGITYRPTS